MIEYGHAVGSGSGAVPRSGGGGSSVVDVGGNIASMAGGFAHDAAHTVAGLPPVALAGLAAVLVFAAFLFLRRAF
jgi:hypothetical protein